MAWMYCWGGYSYNSIITIISKRDVPTNALDAALSPDPKEVADTNITALIDLEE